MSICCRLLLLRLSSLRSLDSRNCLGLRCLMLLLDRFIFTISGGSSGGTWYRSGRQEANIVSLLAPSKEGEKKICKGEKVSEYPRACQRGIYRNITKTTQSRLSGERFMALGQMCKTHESCAETEKGICVSRKSNLSASYMFSRCFVGCVQSFKFSKWSRGGQRFHQRLTYAP